MIKLTAEGIMNNLEEMNGNFEVRFSLEELGIENNFSGQQEFERLEKIADEKNIELWFDFNDDNLQFTLEDN